MTIACAFSASEVTPFVDVAAVAKGGFPWVMLADLFSNGGRVSFISGRGFEFDRLSSSKSSGANPLSLSFSSLHGKRNRCQVCDREEKFDREKYFTDHKIDILSIPLTNNMISMPQTFQFLLAIFASLSFPQGHRRSPEAAVNQ